jgi:membrane associated rhomboid family serine protease
MILGPPHNAIGFSTAVFGTAGLLSGMGVHRERGARMRNWFVPLAAGLAILSLLGSGGERTDLGAHLWGLVAGIVLGIGTGYAVKRMGRPDQATQLALYCGGVLLLCGGWFWAFQAT